MIGKDGWRGAIASLIPYEFNRTLKNAFSGILPAPKLSGLL
jgi:hypothetical protein